MFQSRIIKLKNWHMGCFTWSCWHPIKVNPLTFLLFFIAVSIAVAANWYVRDWQYKIWEQNKDTFYFEANSKTFTTADAPYFLGVAQTLKKSESLVEYDSKRLYPTKPPWIDRSLSPPLLSTIIKIIAASSSQEDLLFAANSLIPVMAVLTALMVAFSFGSMGFWLEGAIASAGSGLSFAFISRSGAGRIDTDLLNLGFFYLMLGLVVFASRTKNLLAALCLSAVCGFAYYIFDLWYSKPFFGWAFLVGLVWLTLITTADVKRVVLLSSIFLMASGLWMQGLGVSLENAYLVSTFDIKDLVFPNVLETVTETRKIPMVEILERISGSIYIAVFSILGLALWSLRHPGYAVVFAPALGFFLLNYLVGNRAIFYSAPMFWFGFGWLGIILSKLLVSYLRIYNRAPVIHFTTTVFAIILAWFVSPTKYIQSPTFDRQTVELFNSLPDLVDEKEFIVATWWDYGYLSMFLNGQPTLHDGGAQTTPATYFFAEAMLTDMQSAAAKRLKKLSHFGAAGVIESFNEGSNKGPRLSNKPVYLVLTRDMVNWMPSISSIGNWDIKTGKIKPAAGMGSSYSLAYQKLKCRSTEFPSKPICNGEQLDLKTGNIGKNRIIDGIVMAKNGFHAGGKAFNSPTLPFVLHSEIGQLGGETLLMHKDLYSSVFHQLFFLGKGKKDVFELIYDGFPHARVYLVH